MKFRSFISGFVKSRVAVTSSLLILFAFFSIQFEYYLINADMKPVYAVICVQVVYLLLSLLIYNILKSRYSSLITDNGSTRINSKIQIELYNHIPSPIALVEKNGTITWGNKAFGEMFRASNTTSRSLDSLLGFDLQSLSDAGEEGLVWESAQKFYKVTAMSALDNNTVITWQDITELEKAEKKIADEQTLFAIIVLDNIDEISQIDSRFAVSAAAKINSVLLEWAGSVNGTMKEYERNKYLFAFSAKYLTGFLEDGFYILNTVRAIGKQTDNTLKSELTVTVSIGIGAVGGSLAEKERASRAAIELALARGGDQAIIKNEADVQYYGGLTKTSQKRSTVRSRIVADSLVELISQSSAVFVMGHKYADFDAFGACVGIARISMSLSKPCYILRSPRNTNLVKCFGVFGEMPDYKNVLIHAEEAKALKGSENPLLVIVDVNNSDNFEFPELADIFPRKILIDHHRMAGEFKYPPLLQYVDSSASSTCELICEILDQALPDIKLQKEEANIMLAGIMLDTKRFVLNTGVRTFSAAQYLRGQDADPSVAQAYFTSDIDSIQREAKFESRIRIYKKVIAISIIDEECSAEDRIPAAKAADNMLTIDGILASFAICRIVSCDSETVRISARSTGKVNVQLIMESLGGGGHYDQAASERSGVSIQEMLIKLTETIDDYLENNPGVFEK